MAQDILVLTATLGERESLKRTIESVRTIGGERVRHIIVCPKKSVESVKSKYGDIECLEEPEGKKGIYAALNYGFNKYGRDYKYLTFINDDDYWLPDYRKLIDCITQNEDLNLVYGRTRYVNENNIMIGVQGCCPWFEAFIPLFMNNVIMITQQATLIRSSLYFDLGGYDESYKLIADTKFWVLASQLKLRYKYLNSVCASYMIQDGQLSSDHQTQSDEHKKLIEELDLKGNRTILTLIAYRLYNFPLYLKRIFKFKGHIMRPYLGGVSKCIVTLLPWRLKRYVLNKFFLYDISPSAKIGFSYIFPSFLKMEDGARIGHFNVAIHLDKMEMGNNSSIGRNNWITGFPTNTHSKHFSHDSHRRPELIIGYESAITKNHHIDCTNAIHIGNYVTIAGYSSQFLTHSIDIYKNRQDSHPITIGDYCFVSTGVKVLGGAELPAYSVLGAGAVLSKAYTEQYLLYAGVPAVPKKKIDVNASYFKRTSGFVY